MQQIMLKEVSLVVNVDDVNDDISTLNCKSLRTRIMFNLCLNPQHLPLCLIISKYLLMINDHVQDTESQGKTQKVDNLA